MNIKRISTTFAIVASFAVTFGTLTSCAGTCPVAKTNTKIQTDQENSQFQDLHKTTASIDVQVVNYKEPT